MAGERKFTRIPPESTGDRVRMVHSAQIEFDGKSGYDTVRGTSHTWQIGELYDVSSFGKVHLHSVYERGDGSGILSVHYSDVQVMDNSTPANNAVISLDGDNVADVNGAPIDVYTPGQNIVGYDNPAFGWNVDRFGSGQMTFREGPPEVSAFGHLRTTDQVLIGRYSFDKSRLTAQFSNVITGAGTVTYESGFSATKLLVGDTLNDTATHTSNTYHPYVPGSNTVAYISTRLGEAGDVGLIRNWGLFDAKNGFFFSEKDGVMNVAHRYTFNGITTTDFITQNDWNLDTLDGTGGEGNASGMALNALKNNMYWVDFQHLGGSRIRYGVYYKGQRLTVHEIYLENVTNHNAVNNPNLPICWANKVYDAPAWSGTDKTMFLYGAGVWSESQGNTDVVAEGPLRHYDDNFTVQEIPTPINNGTSQPWTQGAYYLTTLRPFSIIPDELGNPQENHSLYLPIDATAEVYNDSSLEDVKGELRIFSQCILKNGTYTPIRYSTVEQSKDAFHVGHGPEIYRQPLDGVEDIEFYQVFKDIQDGTIKNNSEQTGNRFQLLAFVTNAFDKEGTGHNSVGIKVGPNPIYLSENVHLFADGQAVTLDGLSLSGPNSLNGNTYYLSVADMDDAYLYETDSALADDRITRVLNVSGMTPNSVNGADSCRVVGISGKAANVLTYDSDLGEIAVYGRSDTLLDSGSALSLPANLTVNGTLVGQVDSITLDASAPTDYYTHLKAVDGSGWANATETSASATISGVPPFQLGWTFMWRPRGGRLPEGIRHRVNLSVHWKEILQ